MTTRSARQPSLTVVSALVIAMFLAVIVFLLAVGYVLAGVGQQMDINRTYVVGFASPDEECPWAGAFFDEATGESLACVVKGAVPLSEATLPGFTEEQNQNMVDLAETLGDDGPGLSAADQREIQDLVDTYAATVPESKRPTYDEGFFSFGLHGTTLAVTGGVVALLALAGGLGALWMLRRT